MDQLIILKLIFSFILDTYLVDIVLILLGKILSWSLMGVNGLNWILTIIAWLIAMDCANFITKMKRQKLNKTTLISFK